MTQPAKTFQQFVNDLQTQWANALKTTGVVPALQDGDAILALFKAVSGQLVFLQALAQLANQVARAQTSNGADLDSFMAQFQFTRLPATFNTGQVTFGKLSPSTSNVTIPAGSIVQTPGGAAQYQVVADTSQPTWNGPLNAYVMAAGQTSLTATVQATVAGTPVAVAAGALTQIASSLPGIDTVTNGAAINNGLDAELDPAFRARFVQFLAGLAKATSAAILAAINGVQQGLTTSLLENVNVALTTQLGAFVAVIDDGSGNPPAALLTTIFNAVNAVRGFTIQPAVIGVTKIIPTVQLNIRVAPGFVAATVQAAVQAAVVSYTNTIEQNAGFLFISGIEGAATAVPGCAAVQPGQTKINSANTDLALTAVQVPRIGAAQVSVGTY